MTSRISRLCAIVAAAAILPAIVISQAQVKTLVLAGHQGSIPVRQFRGKSYVEVDALAQLASGSVSFNGAQVTLAIPAGGENQSGAEASNPNQAQKAGLSKEFLRTAIGELSAIRDWRAALENAIANQIPLSQIPLSQYQGQASTDLRLLQVAASTDDDHSAVGLFANEYEKMKQLNDNYASQTASLTYIPPNSLSNDQLNQSVIACRQSLEAITSSGQFVDNGACN